MTSGAVYCFSLLNVHVYPVVRCVVDSDSALTALVVELVYLNFGVEGEFKFSLAVATDTVWYAVPPCYSECVVEFPAVWAPEFDDFLGFQCAIHLLRLRWLGLFEPVPYGCVAASNNL